MRGRILDISTEVESLLLQLGASGRGLHEKLSAIEGVISPPMVKKIRWIASVRNKAVHERVVEVDSEDFSKGGAQVVAYLKRLVASITAKQTKHKDPQGSPEPDKPWPRKMAGRRPRRSLSAELPGHHISIVGMVLLPQLISCPAVTCNPVVGFAAYPAKKPAHTKAM